MPGADDAVGGSFREGRAEGQALSNAWKRIPWLPEARNIPGTP